MHRFHVADLQQPVLTGPAAHHCTHVLRLQAGAEVELFDGRGHAVRCRISEAGKHEVRLAFLHHTDTPPLPVRITLAAAIIKKNFDFIIQKATELGVAGIVPLITERTIVRPGKSDRWQEIALEACKQCGNNWLPVIQPPQRFADFSTAAGKDELKLVAALQPDAQSLHTILTAPVSSVTLAIGPEGDFTTDEYEHLRAAGYRPMTLGPLVLRADTAALYALSILHYELIVPAVAFRKPLC